MMIKRLVAIFALSLLFAVQVNAATLTIGGPDSASVGDAFEITISGDFGAQGLIAGGISFYWNDALLDLNSISLELPVAADFSCPGGSNCTPGGADSALIVWGEFLVDLIDPNAGQTLMATLSFTAVGSATEALASFSMTNADDLTGGWFGANYVDIPTPDFGTFEMQIDQVVVPLPAAVWFMIGGLTTLLGFRRL